MTGHVRASSFRPRVFAACVVMTAAVATAVADENWPRWRGPLGSGTSTGAALPVAWSPSSNIAWKTAVPGRGILTCLDVRTDAVVCEGRRPPVPAMFMASPVAYRGHVLMTSEDGSTFVIAAGPTCDVVWTNTVDEPVFASPALSNASVYIRGERHVFAIR